ncbi:MAG: glycosyltransferase [Treponema sp.]|jgi:glycosyltransferase involved in cell wall biosynthesis|nr:glycosyltransferase [Treponema sp.]
MRIALVHYHLRPGGVTQVVLHQARALLEAGDDVLVLSGEAPRYAGEWAGINPTLIPALHYDRCRSGRFSRADLVRDLEGAFQARWRGRPDIVHIHNPLIRKNSLLMGALKILTRNGPLLLQNHDLAEDFRPDVYPGEEYPENCHYGVINSRDYRFLLEAGLNTEGLHLIPNEVRSLTASSGLPKTRYLYPVRGIRRKNVGELLLLSLYIPGAPGSGSGAEKTSAALTLPPTTDQDGPIYRRWKALAAELELPAEFETGAAASFADTLGTARAVISTSIKEGFGFSFLEPWTAGLAAAGRRLDYVCRDFEAAGIHFDFSYNALNIPVEYVEPETLRKKAGAALAGVYAAFGKETPSSLATVLDSVFLGRDFFDFGIMDEDTQERIIRMAVSIGQVRDRIRKANPFLEALGDWRDDPGVVEANRRAVETAYSRERTGTILRNAYRKSLQPVRQRLSRSRLLDLYLDPRRFSLIGVSPPALETEGQQ